MNRSSSASAIAPPICGSVPLPNSSINKRLLESQPLTKCFMLVRCELYVLRSFSILCSSPISMKILLNIPQRELSWRGIGIPHCSIY
ncbi:hypothetical protein EVA_16547 [gut metagenome]|uniref:Uncharacterized protein n=1 Tax=gut metagenome TaxID=749906 RepID=J9C673_9ZZZZ